MVNYYNILEIRPTANADEIKRAFRVLAIKYHPDKTQGDEYFTQKFIKINEAYKVLSEPEARKEYNILYQQIYENKPAEEKQREEKYKEKEQEEQFYYEPFKPFYSTRDRDQQDTPQFNPVFNFSGEKISEETDFFIIPKKIGKIIGGYSNLRKTVKPLTQKQKTINIIKSALWGLLIGAIIFFLAGLTNPVWIVIWFAAPTLIGIWLTGLTNKFEYKNLFVGVNGFAEFKCEGSRENITTATEINFNDVTDLYTYQVDKKVNLNYTGTDYIYVWLDTNRKTAIYVQTGTYDKKDGTRESIDFYFSRITERYWTVYLLDKMEATLQKQGCIKFNLYSHEKHIFGEYIKLGIGFITFIRADKAEFTYKFHDIKKIYSKGSNLHIQHSNFERTLYFFKSGDEDVIPMMNLCNRQYFFKALELLLGYNIN